VARSIVTAWILTIPSSALIAAASYLLLRFLSGPVGGVLHLFGI
jgi:phosphate/sulfate permease